MPRQKLTDAFLRHAKLPAAGQVEYWDTLTPGFGVRVSYGGRKAFVVLTRINGKLHRFTLGAYPNKGLGEARDDAERIIKDGAKGISPKEREAEEKRKTQANKRNTFRAVSEEFMADHAKTLRTRDEMQRIINADLLPAWGDKPIASITRGDAKALIREKARTAPIAANRLLSLISKIFAWALDEEIIQASPAVRLRRPSEEKERERSLTDDEIRKLWPTFTAAGYPFGHGLKFLLVTGQRRGEVAGMKWSEIDGDGPALAQSRSRVIAFRSQLSPSKSSRRRLALASSSLYLRAVLTPWTVGRTQSGAWTPFYESRSSRGAFTTCAARWRHRCVALGLTGSSCRSS
jgi:integrase